MLGAAGVMPPGMAAAGPGGMLPPGVVMTPTGPVLMTPNGPMPLTKNAGTPALPAKMPAGTGGLPPAQTDAAPQQPAAQGVPLSKTAMPSGLQQTKYQDPSAASAKAASADKQPAEKGSGVRLFGSPLDGCTK